MAISKTDILNKALTLVGATPVTSIDDDTNNARVCSRIYELALRAILSENKWNFATTRSTLSAVVATLPWSDPGEIYIYNKPTDCIRIYGMSSPRANWREEGDYIISDTSGLGMRYVYYHDTPSKYPAYFLDAFTDRLASDIAFAIVNSATLGEKYKLLYTNVSLPKAMAANSQTGIQQSMQDDAWELAKHQDTNVNA